MLHSSSSPLFMPRTWKALPMAPAPVLGPALLHPASGRQSGRWSWRESLGRSLGAWVVLLGMLWANVCMAQPDPPSGLYLEDMRSWLKANWFEGYHSGLGYNEGRRQMYGYTDIQADGDIQCIYTGFEQAGGFVTYPNPINAEHIVPQSFFGSAEPMKSDIYILRPAHGSANSARSNDPYGEVNDNSAQWYGVVGNTYTSTGNEPANSDNWSEGSGGVWEPRESKKGDVARAVFYFYTMYPNAGTTITDCGSLQTLYDWHVADPVDAVELSRNDKINEVQGNFNPYIEHPDLVYIAWMYDGTPLDNEGPDFSGTATSVNVSCGITPGALADPNDPCGIASLTWTDVPSGTGGCTGSSGIERTYTATDGCGNTSTFVQLLVVVDVTSPVFDFVPSDETITCDNDTFNPLMATAVDDCSEVMVTVATQVVGGPCPDPYDILRVFTATDACGNVTTATQTIHVNAPGTGCPEDLNGDLIVGVADILEVLGAFGCTGGCPIDFDGDGSTTVADVLILLSAFGQTCN
jgi:hypothetical protein